MKTCKCKILCWFLALSLMGLPVFAVSASVPQTAHVSHCKEMSTTPQQYRAAGKAAMERNQIKACCKHCGDSCSCKDKSLCHSSITHQVSAIVQSGSSFLTVMTTELVTEFQSRYHSRDIEPEKTPPIA